MTPVAKKIKTLLLSYTRTAGATSTDDEVAVDSHVFQEDVTIVGALLRSSMLDGDFGWDSGRFTCLAELSRVARLGQPGCIIQFCNHLICREATVGINATQTVVGNPERSELLMFNEGYGIDVDEDGIIYLNTSWRNDMANAHQISIGCVIYYVER